MKDSKPIAVDHDKKYNILGYAFSFCLGGFVWMLIDVYVTKGIDASFVSAVMDTLVVIIAIAALIKAQQFWSDRTKQEGHNIALKLLNETLLESTLSHKLGIPFARANAIFIGYINLMQNVDKTPQEVRKTKELRFVKDLSEVHEDLSNILYTTLFPYNQEIQFNIFRMRNTGVDFSKNEHGVLLSGHFKTHMELTIGLESLIYELRQYLSHFYDGEFLSCYENKDIIYPQNSSEYIVYLNSLSKNIKALMDKTSLLRENLNDATENKKTLTSYFVFN